jgi:hypothetical protein
MAWKPADEQPIGGWYVTRHDSEIGFNVTQRISETEWCDVEGRTTVTHSTFLPPTKYFARHSCTKPVDAREIAYYFIKAFLC